MLLLADIPVTPGSCNIDIQFWVAFNIDQLLLDPELLEVTDFLQYLYGTGIKYSGCNIPESALSFDVNDDKIIGKNEEVFTF